MQLIDNLETVLGGFATAKSLNDLLSLNGKTTLKQNGENEMKASKLGMYPFTLFAYLLDDKGRVIEEVEWGEFNDLNEAHREIKEYQNEKLKFQIA
ncbi:hypothetical protein P4T89_13010 [Bacillus nakamurai]|uniref:Uncharacterized protein n=1 Tax=Bacillus nakamurai TaxID=1793963 RepID=A0A150FAR8_9BACI|nr:hypothetical protein [Bacillus nakamurai]KXZ22342.1 hypothetical protein AXI58_10145 [Bacillus nakamurai]MED1228436.1 hypothetical protein [Bacillus nakamurai]